MSIQIQFSYVGATDVKATKIFYANPQNSNPIEVEVSVFRIAENGKIWKNLELYRKLIRDSDQDSANVLFDKYKSIFYDTIDKLYSNPFPDFDFDTFIAFYPEDKNRRELLKFFVEKTVDGICDFEERDKSNSFEKIDKAKSITEGLTEGDFTLDVNCLKEMRKLLLIDDVINYGRTINILLNKLAENDIDLTNIEIKLICIYNNLSSSGLKTTCH